MLTRFPIVRAANVAPVAPLGESSAISFAPKTEAALGWLTEDKLPERQMRESEECTEAKAAALEQGVGALLKVVADAGLAKTKGETIGLLGEHKNAGLCLF